MAWTKINIKDKDPYYDVWNAPGDVPDAHISTPPYDPNTGAAECGDCRAFEHQHGYVATRQNIMQRVHPGDYILREKRGSEYFYRAMRPDDFTFEYA